MAEPKVFGFRKEPAQILKRVADREGLAPRFGSKVKYPEPLGGQGVWLGKTDSAINKGSSGTVSIWIGDAGSETDSGDNLEDCVNKFANVGSGKWVVVTAINGGLYLTSAEC